MKAPCVDSGRPVMFEQLEPRLLLDGNVDVWAANGDLHVRGDAADNDITIKPKFGPFPLAYEVESPSGTTTINGAAGPVTIHDVTDDFNLDFTRGGDNDVVLDKDALPYFQVHDRLTYRGGPGKDDVELKGVLVAGRTKLLTGAGDDTVAGLEGSYFNGKVTVRSGAGIDDVYLGTFTTLHRGAYINTGSGGDTVGLATALYALGKVKVRTRGGADTVNVWDTAYFSRQLDIATGVGDDTVLLSTNVGVGRKATVSTGSGSDSVDISTDVVFDKRFVLKTGSGDDVLNVGDTEFKGVAAANGGPGTDDYNDGGGIVGTLNLTSFEV